MKARRKTLSGEDYMAAVAGRNQVVLVGRTQVVVVREDRSLAVVDYGDHTGKAAEDVQ